MEASSRNDWDIKSLLTENEGLPSLNLSTDLSKLHTLNALLAASGMAGQNIGASVEEAKNSNVTDAHGLPSDGNFNQPLTYLIEPACEARSFRYVDYTQKEAVRNAFVVVYAMVVVLSVTGNLMVIWTVWRKKHMRTVTNYYIVNLAVSDFLVALFVVPLKLLEYTAPCSWYVFTNDTLCSALSFVLPVFVFASVLTLVAISLERYYAIVHPLSSIKIHCKSRTRVIILSTWIVAVVMAAPYIYYKSYPFFIYSPLGSLSRQICTDRFDEIDQALYGPDNPAARGRFRKGFFLFLFVTVYLVPLAIIITTSVRIAACLLQPISDSDPRETRHRITRKREESKRKVARMMIVVAAGFVISWTPFYVITFISQVQTHSFLKQSNYLFTMLCIHWFGFLNSCVNPVIYNFMNDKFNRSFRQFLTMFKPRLPCCCGRHATQRWSHVSLTPRYHAESFELQQVRCRSHPNAAEGLVGGASVVVPAFQSSEQASRSLPAVPLGVASKSCSSTPPEDSSESRSSPQCERNRFRSRMKAKNQSNLRAMSLTAESETSRKSGFRYGNSCVPGRPLMLHPDRVADQNIYSLTLRSRSK